LVLALKGYKVTVVARHVPGDLSTEYTSPWAGAQWLSNAESDREEEFDRITYETFWEIATKHPESGVWIMDCVEYYGQSLKDTGMVRPGRDEVWFKNLVRDFREVSVEELPAGAKSGISMRSFSINPQIYLPYLQSQLFSLGATFIRRHISHIREAFAITKPVAVINATGLLALKLGGVEDQNVFPTRAQTILVRNECSKMISFTAWHKTGQESTYIIPRAGGGGSILGGCRQPHDWYIAFDLT
jgi:glycine/D-amino acid oxidase-like deaminating enzyme